MKGLEIGDADMKIFGRLHHPTIKKVKKLENGANETWEKWRVTTLMLVSLLDVFLC